MRSKRKATTAKFNLLSKMQLKKNLVAAILCIAIVSACSKSAERPAESFSTDCSGPVKTFAGDVKPLLQAACGGCHGAGSSNGPGALVSYGEVFNSRTAISTAITLGTMPKNGTLTPDQKNSILCWIASGAPNN